jgi:hypothetical protein
MPTETPDPRIEAIMVEIEKAFALGFDAAVENKFQNRKFWNDFQTRVAAIINDSGSVCCEHADADGKNCPVHRDGVDEISSDDIDRCLSLHGVNENLRCDKASGHSGDHSSIFLGEKGIPIAVVWSDHRSEEPVFSTTKENVKDLDLEWEKIMHVFWVSKPNGYRISFREERYHCKYHDANLGYSHDLDEAKRVCNDHRNASIPL